MYVFAFMNISVHFDEAFTFSCVENQNLSSFAHAIIEM